MRGVQECVQAVAPDPDGVEDGTTCRRSMIRGTRVKVGGIEGSESGRGMVDGRGDGRCGPVPERVSVPAAQ